MSEHPSNAEAIADSKIPPGDDYEEIREQVRVDIECPRELFVLPSFGISQLPIWQLMLTDFNNF
jgi:nuclear transcription Y subunit beta